MKAEESIEFSLKDKYPIKPAHQMSRQEFCNWIALCNALKFINNASALTGRKIDETEIIYKDVMTYIDAVSGDIETCIEKVDGVPFKYSLSSKSEDSREVADLRYEFLKD